MYKEHENEYPLEQELHASAESEIPAPLEYWGLSDFNDLVVTELSV